MTPLTGPDQFCAANGLMHQFKCEFQARSCKPQCDLKLVKLSRTAASFGPAEDHLSNLTADRIVIPRTSHHTRDAKDALRLASMNDRALKARSRLSTHLRPHISTVLKFSTKNFFAQDLAPYHSRQSHLLLYASGCISIFVQSTPTSDLGSMQKTDASTATTSRQLGFALMHTGMCCADSALRKMRFQQQLPSFIHGFRTLLLLAPPGPPLPTQHVQLKEREAYGSRQMQSVLESESETTAEEKLSNVMGPS